MTGGQRTILVVEDETTILELIVTILEMEGHHVLATTSAHEAIELGATHASDVALVVTDVMMPEMHGGDLVRELAARGVAAPTLFMSGYTAAIVAEGIDMGAGAQFIQKPFTLAELATKVREALAG